MMMMMMGRPGHSHQSGSLQGQGKRLLVGSKQEEEKGAGKVQDRECSEKRKRWRKCLVSTPA